MTDATAMDEFDAVLGVMIAEREDDRTRLNAAQLGIVRHLARLTISDDPRDAKILTDLLPLAPSVISPGRLPPLTLEQVTRDDAPLDITRLSNEQLVQLEGLEAVMCGRACPVKSPRHESALALVWLIDEAVRSGERLSEERARELVAAVLAPVMAPEALYPSHQEQLTAERSRCLALEEKLRRAEHELESLRSGKVVALESARSKAEREGPITAEKQCHDLAIL
jgi:hypothetical protein